MLFYHASFYCSYLLTYFFLIPPVLNQIFNPTADLVIPTGIVTTEAKAEMETHSVFVETKISKCSI